LTGFLKAGAKLNTILTNLSVPRDADDERAPSERRMDALDQICTKVLGMVSTDNGIRRTSSSPSKPIRSGRWPTCRPQGLSTSI